MSKMDLQDSLQVASTSKTFHVNGVNTTTPEVNLEEWQTDVKVHVIALDGAVTINLPSPGICKGKTFTIEFVDTPAGINCTIVGSVAGKLAEGWSNIVLTAANDRAVLRSNGVTWLVLEDVST